MEIFGINITRASKNVDSISNIDKRLPKKADATRIANVLGNARIRAEQTVQKFRQAQRDWENPFSPQRRRMYDIYRDAIIDAQVSACLNTRKYATTSAGFRVVDSDGKEDKELTKLFEKKWFYDFVGNAVESNFWGFTLHQLGPIKDDSFSWTEAVDRYNVKPERSSDPKFNFQIVTKHTSDLEGTPFYREPLKTWTVPDGSSSGKGILEQVSLIYLYKRWALGAWSEFAEIYGQPTRIGKTDVRDEESFSNMVEMLSSMGSNTWGVFNHEDELEFIDSMKNSTGLTVYENLSRYADEQISKAILGQTMTTDNGSSRSQAEVHENIANLYFVSDQKEIEFLVNGELIPRMIKIGRGGIYSRLEGYRWEFWKEEKISLKDRSEIDSNISSKMNKTFTKDYIEKTYNVELEEEDSPATPGEIQNIYNV